MDYFLRGLFVFTIVPQTSAARGPFGNAVHSVDYWRLEKAPG
jgi:hypothetical protein